MQKKNNFFLGGLDSFFGSSETHISGSVFETPIDTVYLLMDIFANFKTFMLIGTHRVQWKE